MRVLAPSILSADFSALGEDVRKAREGGAGLIHIDVMDGHFVPNISFGPYVMKCLAGKAGLPFDVHLMIEDPDRYAADFVTETTEYITVQQEAVRHLHRSLEYIRSLGVGAGVAVNPGTPVTVLEEVLDIADLVLVMSVDPGFGGQRMIESTLGKVRRLVEIREERGLAYKIEIDGGVTAANMESVCEAGADIIVAGSSVFDADDITAAAAELAGIAKRY